jgi:hypothetical protein
MSIDFQQLEPFEEWRPVLGHEKYYLVSNFGRVQSLPREKRYMAFGRECVSMLSGRILAPGTDAAGYFFVVFSVKGKRKLQRIHALVAEAFIGPRPQDKWVHHRDGNNRNNCAYNLQYVTPKEHSKFPSHSIGRKSRLSRDALIEIRRLRLEGMKLKDLAAMFGVSRALISMIARNKRGQFRT